MSVLKQTARRGRTEENPRAALNDINAQTDASGAYLREAADDMTVLPVKPLADIMANYTCHDRNQKGE